MVRLYTLDFTLNMIHIIDLYFKNIMVLQYTIGFHINLGSQLLSVFNRFLDSQFIPGFIHIYSQVLYGFYVKIGTIHTWFTIFFWTIFIFVHIPIVGFNLIMVHISILGFTKNLAHSFHIGFTRKTVHNMSLDFIKRMVHKSPQGSIRTLIHKMLLGFKDVLVNISMLGFKDVSAHIYALDFNIKLVHTYILDFNVKLVRIFFHLIYYIYIMSNINDFITSVQDCVYLLLYAVLVIYLLLYISTSYRLLITTHGWISKKFLVNNAYLGFIMTMVLNAYLGLIKIMLTSILWISLTIWFTIRNWDSLRL